MTDMALEKSHWWIMFIVMCPTYMCCNWYGAMTLGNMATGKKGQIYGPEMWDTNVPLTMFYFAILAAAQAGIYYCLCTVVEKIWPKRPEEEFENAG